MSGTLVREPCIEYASKFKHSKLEKVELLQTWDDGTKTKKKCPVFTGEYGIETLLYVEDRFNSICRQLEILDGEELFDNFTEVVSNQAENKWETLTGNLTPQQKTVARFRQAMDEFYLSYCDDDSRDIMFAYLRKFKKPYDMAAGEHADRMEILVKYSNKLPGMEPEMNEDQIKRLIFESFPVKWQHAYIQSGRRIQSESLIRVVQYMKDETSFSDSNSNKRKRSESDNQHNTNRPGRGMRANMRGGFRGGRGRGRSSGRSNPCRIHAGQHEWIDCWDNENGPNYRPNRPGGRGGRGRQQNWRGGRGFGRNNYYQNSGRGNVQNNYGGYNQGQMQPQREQYHNEHGRLPITNSTMGASTISSDSYHQTPARAAPSQGYVGDLHQLEFMPNEYGSAWSTGTPHTARQNGGRYY